MDRWSCPFCKDKDKDIQSFNDLLQDILNVNSLHWLSDKEKLDRTNLLIESKLGIYKEK